MRMIHHSTRCTTFSDDSVKATNGSARLPSFSAAMPTATEITMICSTLNETVEVTAPVVASAELETVRPRKFCGIRPLRKFHHVPTA